MEKLDWILLWLAFEANSMIDVRMEIGQNIRTFDKLHMIFHGASYI